MRTFLVVIGLIALCSAQTSLQNLQQVMNGAFAQVNLPAPTQAINCFTESDASDALSFASTILNQVANDDIFSISSTIKSFSKSYPSSVVKCLAADSEITQLEAAYGITASTFSSDPIEYVLTHLGSLKSDASTGASDLSSGSYEAFGALVGQMAQQYVQSDDFFAATGSALTNLQQVMNGVFAQVNLPAPTQAINCFTESDASDALSFASTILNQVANDDIFSISSTVKNFGKSFPSSVATCLQADSEITQLEAAYGITASTFSSDPLGYVLTHLGSLKSDASTGASDLSAGSYEAFGTLAGQMVQQFVQSDDFFAATGDALSNLQEIMNGFFAQAGLPAPTQAINCFDESDAETALTFASTILTQVSKDDIFSISGTINSFKNNFPSTVATCLKSDPEMTQLKTAYGITSSTFSSDPIEYVLTHLGSLKSSASTGASDLSSGDYEALGTLGGQMVQQFVESQ